MKYLKEICLFLLAVLTICMIIGQIGLFCHSTEWKRFCEFVTSDAFFEILKLLIVFTGGMKVESLVNEEKIEEGKDSSKNKQNKNQKILVIDFSEKKKRG